MLPPRCCLGSRLRLRLGGGFGFGRGAVVECMTTTRPTIERIESVRLGEGEGEGEGEG